MPRPFVHAKGARHAVKIRLRATVSGRARIRVRTHGRTVARAVRTLRAGQARTVTARLTRRARRAAQFAATAHVRLPGLRQGGDRFGGFWRLLLPIRAKSANELAARAIPLP